jgi:tricorn protease-like protein
MYHSQYKVDLPLDKEIKGTWTVEGGKLIRTVQLSNGDTIRILSRIDPLVATEFVEISDGVDGPVKAKYQRESTRTRKKPT